MARQVGVKSGLLKNGFFLIIRDPYYFSMDYKGSVQYMVFVNVCVLVPCKKVASASGGLTLPMLRLLSSKAQGRDDFWKTSKSCHVGSHRMVLAEYSQMSTHVWVLVIPQVFVIIWCCPSYCQPIGDPSVEPGIFNACRSRRTTRSDADFASLLNMTKLRKPWGRSSNTSKWASLPRESSRLQNCTESSTMGSRWQAWNIVKTTHYDAKGKNSNYEINDNNHFWSLHLPWWDVFVTEKYSQSI